MKPTMKLQQHPAQYSRRLATLSRQASSSSQSASSDSRNTLEAFFYGRALFQTVGDRLNDIVADTIADLGILQAEVQKGNGGEKIQQFFAERQEQLQQLDVVQEWTSLQASVAERAQEAMVQSTGAVIEAPEDEQTGNTVIGGELPDLEEVVDNLRAQIAETRATIVSLKKKSGGTSEPTASSSTSSAKASTPSGTRLITLQPSSGASQAAMGSSGNKETTTKPIVGTSSPITSSDGGGSSSSEAAKPGDATNGSTKGFGGKRTVMRDLGESNNGLADNDSQSA